MSKRKTTEEFIIDAIFFHGYFYDYSETVYISARDYVTIICPIHGKFNQLACNHLTNKIGCPYCVKENRQKSLSLTKEQFVERSDIIHNNKYDYSEFIYVNMFTKGIIICPIHGKFEQIPSNHLGQKQGCPICAIEDSKLSLEEFIEKSRKIHGDKYDYSEFIYINSYTKGTIICPQHGRFEQEPRCHYFYGNGCPICSLSYSRLEEEFRQMVQLIDTTAYKTKRGEIIPKQELDVYIPKKKIAFEFNGRYWHDTHIDQFERDQRKELSCINAGIKLYIVWADEWKNNPDKVKKRIIDILNG